LVKFAGIGLTGGIGSGKSTVAQALVACGAVLVDTDAIARSLTAAGGAALPRIVERFGAAVIGADGALDRERMRQLHPLIGEQAMREAGAAAGRTVVFDVPLLAESRHWRARVDRVLVVDCREATQVTRVVQRSAWSEDAVQRVIAQQAPRAARRAIADAVIFNDDGLTLDSLREQVRSLAARWLA
jgi:dephospho-CoA kinase